MTPAEIGREKLAQRLHRGRELDHAAWKDPDEGDEDVLMAFGARLADPDHV